MVGQTKGTCGNREAKGSFDLDLLIEDQACFASAVVTMSWSAKCSKVNNDMVSHAEYVTRARLQ